MPPPSLAIAVVLGIPGLELTTTLVATVVDLSRWAARSVSCIRHNALVWPAERLKHGFLSSTWSVLGSLSASIPSLAFTPPASASGSL
jgi:hypothetical protein